MALNNFRVKLPIVFDWLNNHQWYLISKSKSYITCGCVKKSFKTNQSSPRPTASWKLEAIDESVTVLFQIVNSSLSFEIESVQTDNPVDWLVQLFNQTSASSTAVDCGLYKLSSWDRIESFIGGIFLSFPHHLIAETVAAHSTDFGKYVNYENFLFYSLTRCEGERNIIG